MDTCVRINDSHEVLKRACSWERWNIFFVYTWKETIDAHLFQMVIYYRERSSEDYKIPISMIVRIMRWSQKGKKGLSTVNIVKFTHLPGFLPVRQWIDCCRSFTQSCLTLYNPMGWQHTRLPCPSPSPGVCSNLCPLSWWCHPTITSLWPLLLLPSLFPSIRVFPIESALRLRWPKYWSDAISPSHPL